MRIEAETMPGNTKRPLVRGALRCVAAAAALMASTVACSGSQEPPRQYSDDELELDEVVDKEIIADTLPFALYRTLDEMNQDVVDPTAGSGHERERNKFEHTIALVMIVAGDTLPPDVATGSGVLHDAVVETLDQCAADAGWSGVQVYDVSHDDVIEYERKFGLTLEMFFDLRHECSKYAATYPTLDPDVRDELLAKRRGHYMAKVREWMAANPGLVVPVEYHEGANKPVEDRWRRVCKQAEDHDYDYEQCLRDARVEPP